MNETRHDHIITLEDPIEYVIASKGCHVNQREVHTHTKILRRTPSAARCVKIRTSSWSVKCATWKPSQLAITASETGHLVLGTLHTGNAARTLDRVLDVFPVDQRDQIRVMVTESLRGIISQQLVPRADGNGRVLALEILVQHRRRRHLHPRRQDLHAPRRHADRRKRGHAPHGRLAARTLSTRA